jgi:hypothetical protein
VAGEEVNLVVAFITLQYFVSKEVLVFRTHSNEERIKYVLFRVVTPPDVRVRYG